jgi:RNA polymerase sigma factor (sigma-70 family)
MMLSVVVMPPSSSADATPLMGRTAVSATGPLDATGKLHLSMPALPGSLLTPDEDALVVDNLALVHWVVRRWGAAGNYEDRVQDGMFGLMRAAQLYDPSRGFAFATYAVPWIRQAIGRGLDIELGLNRRSALRAGHEWRPPAALDAATSPDGRPLVDTLRSNEDDPADIAERTLAVAPIFAACRDELDRAVVVAVATGASLRTLAREQHIHYTTAYNRLDRITATVTGTPLSSRPRAAAAAKAMCVDCGGPCSKTRCRPCYNTWVNEQLDHAEAS